MRLLHLHSEKSCPPTLPCDPQHLLSTAPCDLQYHTMRPPTPPQYRTLHSKCDTRYCHSVQSGFTRTLSNTNNCFHAALSQPCDPFAMRRPRKTCMCRPGQRMVTCVRHGHVDSAPARWGAGCREAPRAAQRRTPQSPSAFLDGAACPTSGPGIAKRMGSGMRQVRAQRMCSTHGGDATENESSVVGADLDGRDITDLL